MMTVALPTELEELVNAKIQSGQYHSAGEVIREGLRLLEEKDMLRQIKLDQLRKDIAIGIEQADRGDPAPLDVEAVNDPSGGPALILHCGRPPCGRNLQLRFNKFLHFDDYAPDELTEIFGTCSRRPSAPTRTAWYRRGWWTRRVW